MAMSEANFWANLRPKMKEAGLDPYRVENNHIAGIPDVNISTGWVELKYVPRTPSRETSALRLPGFTRHQKKWITQRIRSGGNVWVMLKIGNQEWFIIEGDPAAALLGEVPVSKLRELAIWHSRTAPTKDTLQEYLTKRTYDAGFAD